MTFNIINDECVQAMQTMAANSIDAIVTDPPYGLSFMGKKWDYEVPSVVIWAECLRVLKPGGHLLAFAGTRTQHRMAANIEDAGFEIRDMIAWVYGSGFPKSLDASKAIDRVRDWSKFERLGSEIKRARKEAGFSLREIGDAMQKATGGRYGAWYHQGGHMFFETGRSLPSQDEWEYLRSILPIAREFQDAYDEAEREIIGRKKVIPGVAFSSEGPSELDVTAPATIAARRWSGWGTALKPAMEPITVARKPLEGTVAENVMKHGTGAINVDGCRVDGPPSPCGTKSGSSALGQNSGWNEHENRITKIDRAMQQGRWPANLIHDGSEEVVGLFPITTSGMPMKKMHTDGGRNVASGASAGGKYFHDGFGDSGSAARFFYCAKATKADRDEGCDSLRIKPSSECVRRADGTAEINNTRAGAGRTSGSRNHHPTVKPTTLMRYLCRLVTPPNGTILDPFMGSGSTGKAAVLEGFNFIGIEREADYCAISKARISNAEKNKSLELPL